LDRTKDENDGSHDREGDEHRDDFAGGGVHFGSPLINV
jgi:hypothetical protein